MSGVPSLRCTQVWVFPRGFCFSLLPLRSALLTTQTDRVFMTIVISAVSSNSPLIPPSTEERNERSDSAKAVIRRQRLRQAPAASRLRADSGRPGHALWRTHAALLAARRRLQQSDGPPSIRPHSRRGSDSLSRQKGSPRPALSALHAPRHDALLRQGLRGGHSLLLPRMAF